MRKIFVFLMALIGLGMMLGGCTSPFGTTKIHSAPVIRNYIEPLKPKESQVVGNKNIKFYIGKVVDSRKSKRIMAKYNGILPIKQGQFIMTKKGFIKTERATISKAIVDTGWGLTENKTDANYVINADIEKMIWERGILYGTRTVKAKICVFTKTKENDNRPFIEKQLTSVTPVLATAGIYRIAGKPFEDFYHALVKFFSSPEFVNAVEHRSVVFDNSSNSKPLSN